MNKDEKIETLAYAICLLGQRLLRLEPSEKYRRWFREMMIEIQHEILECKDKDCKYPKHSNEGMN